MTGQIEHDWQLLDPLIERGKVIAGHDKSALEELAFAVATLIEAPQSTASWVAIGAIRRAALKWPGVTRPIAAQHDWNGAR